MYTSPSGEHGRRMLGVVRELLAPTSFHVWSMAGARAFCLNVDKALIGQTPVEPSGQKLSRPSCRACRAAAGVAAA